MDKPEVVFGQRYDAGQPAANRLLRSRISRLTVPWLAFIKDSHFS